MPTGYTNSLDENPEMKTQQWIMEHLARAFGICITLKEESFNLSEKDILKKLSDDSTVEYHKEALAKARKESVDVSNRTVEAWRKLWEKSEAEKVTHNKKSIAKTNALKTRHDAVKADLQKIFISSKVSEVTKNIVKFGIEQLDTVERFDCEPYISEPTTFEDFVNQQKATAIRDISYHSKELEKAKSRAKERVDLYLRLRQDVNLILGE